MRTSLRQSEIAARLPAVPGLPWFRMWWGAVFADVGVTLLAVFNSLRTLVQPSPLR